MGDQSYKKFLKVNKQFPIYRKDGSGWPYTCEQTNKLAKGANTTLVENQSRDSRFKLRFESGGGVAGVGKIYFQSVILGGILMDPPKITLRGNIYG